MVPFKTRSDFPFIKQIGPSNFRRPERTFDKLNKEISNVHKQEKREDNFRFKRNNVI